MGSLCFFRNATNVPGNEKKMANEITNKYKIKAPKHTKKKNSNNICPLKEFSDIVRTNLLAYSMGIS